MWQTFPGLKVQTRGVLRKLITAPQGGVSLFLKRSGRQTPFPTSLTYPLAANQCFSWGAAGFFIGAAGFFIGAAAGFFIGARALATCAETCLRSDESDASGKDTYPDQVKVRFRERHNSRSSPGTIPRKTRIQIKSRYDSEKDTYPDQVKVRFRQRHVSRSSQGTIPRKTLIQINNPIDNASSYPITVQDNRAATTYSSHCTNSRC